MTPTILAAAALLLASAAAEAQSFRCTTKEGRKYYGSTIPPQCVGRLVEQLNAQGTVIKRIDPDGEEKDRQAKAAEAAKKRAEAAAAREAERRNRAILATYTSEKDVDDARHRALADNEKAIRQVEGRIAEIHKRQAGYQKELEFYKGKNAPPAKLSEDMANADIDLKAQEELLGAKKKEVEAINARYDEDKKRYVDLTRGR